MVLLMVSYSTVSDEPQVLLLVLVGYFWKQVSISIRVNEKYSLNVVCLANK